MSRGARIPANVDREDRLLAGLTARQLAILAAAGLLAWVLVLLARARMVPAPEGVPAPPGWLQAGPGGPLPAPLELPASGLDEDGVVDLGRDGAALVCRASSLTFSLRTPAEQAALVAAFARWLHALGGPVQLLVRAVPVDLDGMITAIEQAAGGLPHLALERAARGHARYLVELAARRDVLGRQILVVFREPAGPAAAELLGRRAEQAASLLAAAGITLRRLNGAQTLTVLGSSARPGRLSSPAEGLAMPGQVITALHVSGGTQ